MTRQLPSHMFVSSTDGALFDTRVANWSNHPLRPNYERTHREINNVADLKATLRNGGYAWPGGYPLYFLTNDGDVISFEAARGNFATEATSIRQRWGCRIVACDVNWEDNEMYCNYTGDKIQSAYGDDE